MGIIVIVIIYNIVIMLIVDWIIEINNVKVCSIKENLELMLIDDLEW